MMLSKDATKLLKRMVKSYRKRMKTGAENPTWFRACQLSTEFKKVKIENFDFAVKELADLNLVRDYIDGGFAITASAISYYEHDHKALFIKIVWFVLGLFTEWLLCKGLDIGFDFLF